MLDLIEILFSRHGIRSVRFDGKMDRVARDQTIAAFKQPGGPKIILIRSVVIISSRKAKSDVSTRAARDVEVLGKASDSENDWISLTIDNEPLKAESNSG